MEYVAATQRCQFGIGHIGFLDRRGRIDDAQAGIAVIALAELSPPVGQFESLINKQDQTTLRHKFPGELYDASSLEVEIIRIDVEAFTLANIEMFLGELQEK